MHITDIEGYLAAHENRQIRSGKSGARVWEIEDRYVLKYVQREMLPEAAAKINEIIGWHHEEEKVLCHGDFHWDNLLRRENGDIVVCDWQGVGAGGASGDISFFLSRLGADGTDIEPGKVTELYCHERFLLTGETVSHKDLLRHMKAANLIISFQCWHQYLHGSSCERVRGIYEKMVMD